LSELALGSAQFGMDYGVSNSTGKPSQNVLSDVLQVAQSANIQIIDTASLYGDAEFCLGNELAGDDYFRFITKLPDLTAVDRESQVVELFLESLHKLRKESLYAILLHRAENLLQNNSDIIYKALLKLKEQGLVDKIGFSSYFPGQVHAITTRYDVDIVQIPMNILDQRFVETQCIEYLKQKNIEIFARSAFLQGLLLMDESHIPAGLHSKMHLLTKYFELTDSHDSSKLELALDFLKNQKDIDYVVVGVQSKNQLQELVSLWDNPMLGINYSELSIQDEELLLPQNWAV
jgi:aryl-alcohol dehydrogenase-like predicted oxidoreductase